MRAIFTLLVLSALIVTGCKGSETATPAADSTLVDTTTVDSTVVDSAKADTIKVDSTK